MRQTSAAKSTGQPRAATLSPVPLPNCFVPGARIVTPAGTRAAEDLRPGDRVMTRDNGPQEICWTGCRGLTTVDLSQHPHLRPVRIPAGALGEGRPARDLMLSPNHRVLSTGDMTALHCGTDEVFVAAKHLTAQPGIRAADLPWVTYLHFMCAAHEVVLADGVWSETYQPAAGPVDGIGNAQRLEIEELFPELATYEGLAARTAARPTLTPRAPAHQRGHPVA
ncbi:Hint domain-containing protein [Roseobacter ponti]|uniref:Hint domain-containing protein n=1 Tax=Roseobacter ponti TaxID=1891787 RepID=A0A858STU8_9RHOB|nr:Hint domain-containing protein [Roseobacter ponti]QJF51388.1 Hint domain-containing protein [Roseobacter ponti]